MTDTTLGLIIGIASLVLTLSNGIIIWIVAGLRDEFNLFRDTCRIRHETVVKKDDYIREYTLLGSKVDALHNRLDKQVGVRNKCP